MYMVYKSYVSTVPVGVHTSIAMIIRRHSFSVIVPNATLCAKQLSIILKRINKHSTRQQRHKC